MRTVLILKTRQGLFNAYRAGEQVSLDSDKADSAVRKGWARFVDEDKGLTAEEVGVDDAAPTNPVNELQELQLTAEALGIKMKGRVTKERLQKAIAAHGTAR